MRKSIIAWTVLLAATAAGCGDTGSSTSETKQNAAADATSAPKIKCRRVGRHLVKTLEGSLVAEENGPKLKGGRLRHVFAFKNGERKNVWFVSGALHGGGFDGDVATWAVTKSALNGGSGLIVPADNFAKEFSEFGDFVKKGSPMDVSFTEDGGSESR